MLLFILDYKDSEGTPVVFKMVSSLVILLLSLFTAQSSSKSEEETTGNESPESGNRDEGYSTMSSDVQTDVTRSSNDGHNGSGRGLEDLKEASDETGESSETRLLISDSKDPDILYIPLNLLNLKSRYVIQQINKHFSKFCMSYSGSCK